MNAGAVFASSFAVGLSGAISPGPLLVVVIAETVQAGLAAPVCMMFGHALLELAMTAGLLFGLQRLRNVAGFEPGLSMTGGLVMVALAADMLRRLGRTNIALPGGGAPVRPLTIPAVLRLAALGAGVSLLNPYWTIWWLTIGGGFMTAAGVATLPKAVAFYTGHILSDFSWYLLVGILVVRGRRLLTPQVYRGALGFFAVVLALFGLGFLRHGIGAL